MKPSRAAGVLAAAALALAGSALPAAAAEPRDAIPAGTYLIASNLTFECMTLTGVDIGAAPCVDYRAVWTVQPVGDGTDEVYIRQGNLCVSDVVDLATGSDLSALPCVGSADERWRFLATAGRGFKISAEPGRVAVVEPPLDYETTNFVRVEPEQDVAPEYWGLYPL